MKYVVKVHQSCKDENKLKKRYADALKRAFPNETIRVYIDKCLTDEHYEYIKNPYRYSNNPCSLKDIGDINLVLTGLKCTKW